MATVFSAPTIDEPARAVGVRHGGISKIETDIVRPMSRLSTDDGTWAAGKQLEFRFRSDSSRFFSPKDRPFGCLSWGAGAGVMAAEPTRDTVSTVAFAAVLVAS
jgi:hypothetical protein